MSFHEIQFPPEVSYRSQGGPGFHTDIITMDSGQEQRVARWSHARRRYDVSNAIKSLDHLSEVQSFYIARQGPAFGFRYKDWMDYTTALNGRGAPDWDDVLIGVGDGETKIFQLIKRYISGPVNHVRRLRKPVDGTVRVGLADAEQLSGWSVNVTTGEITFTDPPSLGVAIMAGCEFDVPVRFGEEVDEALLTSIDFFDTGSAQIPLVEVLDCDEDPGIFFHGGSSTIVFSEDITISLAQGRAIQLVPQESFLDVHLPDPANLVGGGPYFVLHNGGAVSVGIHSSGDGLPLVTSIPNGATRTFVIFTDDGVNQWKGY